MKKKLERKPKALALLSGGLDSLLAVKLILEQKIEVEAVNFSTPFCTCNKCSVNDFVKELNIPIHKIFLGQELLDEIVNPTHGYGSQMNVCIDCRILMFKKAKKLAKEIGADFFVTGEVLDERPFSQRKNAMYLIERESGLEGKVLRPLSAKVLPESEPEKNGLVDRKKFFSIVGRRRLPQIELAKKLKLQNYPTPAGGCLLTDPQFAQRLNEHLKYEKKLTIDDIMLLRIGRHFRVDTVKIIVGRNEGENNQLKKIAVKHVIPYFETKDYNGPITLYLGKEISSSIERAAAITVRYSDAPKKIPIEVNYTNKLLQIIEVQAILEEEITNLRINF